MKLTDIQEEQKHEHIQRQKQQEIDLINRLERERLEKIRLAEEEQQRQAELVRAAEEWERGAEERERLAKEEREAEVKRELEAEEQRQLELDAYWKQIAIKTREEESRASQRSKNGLSKLLKLPARFWQWMKGVESVSFSWRCNRDGDRSLNFTCGDVYCSAMMDQGDEDDPPHDRCDLSRIEKHTIGSDILKQGGSSERYLDNIADWIWTTGFESGYPAFLFSVFADVGKQLIQATSFDVCEVDTPLVMREAVDAWISKQQDERDDMLRRREEVKRWASWHSSMSELPQFQLRTTNDLDTFVKFLQTYQKTWNAEMTLQVNRCMALLEVINTTREHIAAINKGLSSAHSKNCKNQRACSSKTQGRFCLTRNQHWESLSAIYSIPLAMLFVLLARS